MVSVTKEEWLISGRKYYAITGRGNVLKRFVDSLSAYWGEFVIRFAYYCGEISLRADKDCTYRSVCQ